MTEPVKDTPEQENKYLFHRKAIVIVFSVITILIVILDTYYDQKKPYEPRALVPITFTPPPEIPETLFLEEQEAEATTQGYLNDEQ